MRMYLMILMTIIINKNIKSLMTITKFAARLQRNVNQIESGANFGQD